jgi:hypothetical protein
MEWQWEDTNDEWLYEVPDEAEMQCGEWDWEDTNDSWIWEVPNPKTIPSEDESVQYGGRKRKADNDEVKAPEEFYTIKEVRQVKAKKYRTTAVDYTVHFNDLEDLDLVREYERTQEIFEHLLIDVTGGMEETDMIRLVLRTNQLDKPISLPFMPVSRLTPEHVFSQIERVVQSKQELRLNESVVVDIIHVEMPNGSGRKHRNTLDLQSYLHKKGSIIVIKNRDNLCLARALVVAIAKVDGDSRCKYLADSRRSAQTKAAKELHEKAGVPLGSCGIAEVKQFQKYLSGYEINIVSSDAGNTIIYPSQPNVEKVKRIYLYLHSNHYDVITSMPAFLSRGYFCHVCRKSYDKTVDHLCDTQCKMCRGLNCLWGDSRDCQDCGRMFKSEECYARHKEPVDSGGQSVCQQVKRCQRCGKSLRVHLLRDHLCLQTKCKTCGKIVDNKDTHYCYMTKPEEKEGGEEESYDQLFFFDYECRQETGVHEPNLCIVHNEQGDEWCFSGESTNVDFCEWLFTKEHRNCVFIAHNFQGYDGYFIQNFLCENGVKYDVIMSGAKIVTLTVPMFNIRFIDSLNFIPMGLAKFPKTFGLDELHKGYFPHLFNKRENESYVGPIPCEPYYNPNGMSSENRKAFQKWHKEQRDNNVVFDFEKEIIKYCRSDVDILRRSCMEFRELFRDSTEIDPFEKCLTIASACQLVYRTNFLKENTIAIFDSKRDLKVKQSNTAIKWLSYVSEKEGICIEHVRNGGERRDGKYSFDGYHEESNTVYEFQGCFWHGEWNSFLYT